MGRTPSARILARRDAILALLRDSDGFLLTVDEIIDRIGRIMPCGPSGQCHVCVEDGNPGWHRAFYYDVYPQLRILERQGLVRRMSDSQRVFWSWAGPPPVELPPIVVIGEQDR